MRRYVEIVIIFEEGNIDRVLMWRIVLILLVLLGDVYIVGVVVASSCKVDDEAVVCLYFKAPIFCSAEDFTELISVRHTSLKITLFRAIHYRSN